MLCDKSSCTGCMACVSACPHGCISILEDTLGSSFPKIDAKACVNCGRCTDVCPVLNGVSHKGGYMPRAYAFISGDSVALKASTSGGFCSALASLVIKAGGCVFGAVLGDDLSVTIKPADTLEGLKAMSGSKYVFSDASSSYAEVKKLLDGGRTVLYSALPCQIAGLYGYLGRDYDNLLTTDIVCHGSPSQKLFKAAMDDVAHERGTRVVNVQHRFKHKKWNMLIQPTPKYTFKDGSENVVEWYRDPYAVGFLGGLIYRDCCYGCRYAAMPRIADITAGDFFGLGAVKPFKAKCNEGVSQVIVNTEKGASYFKRVCEGSFAEERTLFECLVFNHNLWKPSATPPSREAFLRDFQSEPWHELRKRCFDLSPRFRLTNFARLFVKKLLGARATARLMYIVYSFNGTKDKVNQICKSL